MTAPVAPCGAPEDAAVDTARAAARESGVLAYAQLVTALRLMPQRAEARTWRNMVAVILVGDGWAMDGFRSAYFLFVCVEFTHTQVPSTHASAPHCTVYYPLLFLKWGGAIDTRPSDCQGFVA